ncbi:MAG: NTP transferase domain-containing protein, partial [Kyrpidia sp.]|nr:NTP transferase domain-containing protein [Kyrpidia sp.]
MTPTFGAAILAAGLSTRMGRPKLWLPLGGRPLFYSCVEAAVAAGLSPVILVAGDDPERFRRALDGMPVEVVENPDYRSGMSSSLKVGLSRLSGRVDAG